MILRLNCGKLKNKNLLKVFFILKIDVEEEMSEKLNLKSNIIHP